MRVQVFYDCPADKKGQKNPREDGEIICPPFYGVIDPFSAPYDQEHPMQTFGGLSGGQLLRAVAKNTFERMPTTTSLRRALLQVNSRLHLAFAQEGMGLKADERPGASFVFCKEEDGKLHIVQGGDSRAAWIRRDGRVGITPCLFTPHEKILRDEIARLKLIQGHTGAGWPKRFYEFLCRSRREKSNKFYPVLNGQYGLLRIVRFFSVPIKSLTMVILFTDGMIEWNTVGRRSDRFVVHYIRDCFERDDSTREAGCTFHYIMEQTRQAEINFAETSHVKHAEATCMVITFDD